MVILKFIIKIIVLIVLLALRKGLGSIWLESIIENSVIIAPVLSFLIFLTSINLIIRSCQFFYRKRKKYGHKYSDNVIIGLQNIYYVLTAFGVVFMILGFFGLEPKVLLTSISIVAAAIAIISKEQVTDIICGINISFSRELAIGDYVRVGEQKGIVIDINIHKIMLRNSNDDIIFISNTKAYYSDIVNFTQRAIKKYNLEFALDSVKNISKSEIEIQILNILKEYLDHMEAGSELFTITAIERNEIRYRLQYTLKQVNPQIEQEIKAKVLEEILNLVQKSDTKLKLP
jgi:small-conductance mechanosensitive channel